MTAREEIELHPAVGELIVKMRAELAESRALLRRFVVAGSELNAAERDLNDALDRRDNVARRDAWERRGAALSSRASSEDEMRKIVDGDR